jgi:hypothetical protein
MGTALDSAEDLDDKKAIKEMVDEAAKDPEKNRRMQNAFRDAINDIIFKGQDIAPVRNKVKAAIAKKVQVEVLSKYVEWKKDVKKAQDKQEDPPPWPFPPPR